ncbi:MULTISPECIES: PilZ domain-containing protein [Thiomicrorhabdus]|uniref:PilZ domain-containing protein n=1 Tax=Thiomicrorhabdus heinhorstiae TaxID=2748010 RepID=A0ABS0BY15_9GAMM|nr:MULTISPECIES: PilZ domain-containing protein [Thiomicrorhabdus]MBF6058691.1 PilZ domain-containing protein [Thiomicrorhabdus heinhorstiae]
MKSALQDQRNYFRIDVSLPCSYRILSQEEAQQQPLEQFDDGEQLKAFFAQNIRQIDQQFEHAVGQIQSRSTIVADALNALNMKLNLLLDSIDQKQLSASLPMKMVNLSGGGVAMQMNENIGMSDKIDLLLKPLEDEEPILVRCDVINIQPETHGGFKVALSYQNLKEEDRRKLIYFIQSKEIELAQQQRAAQQ